MTTRARGGTLRRRMLFVHRWLGIILGVYFVMLGITGSLLVFAREIDRALNPELLTMPPRVSVSRCRRSSIRFDASIPTGP